MGLKCENKPWQEISGHYRQMLSPKSPVAQDLQQTHTQAQLLVHAEYENHHLNRTTKRSFHKTLQHRDLHNNKNERATAERNLNARLKANAFRQMWYSQASVTTEATNESYVGLATNFKDRYRNHMTFISTRKQKKRDWTVKVHMDPERCEKTISCAMESACDLQTVW